MSESDWAPFGRDLENSAGGAFGLEDWSPGEIAILAEVRIWCWVEGENNTYCIKLAAAAQDGLDPLPSTSLEKLIEVGFSNGDGCGLEEELTAYRNLRGCIDRLVKKLETATLSADSA